MPLAIGGLSGISSGGIPGGDILQRHPSLASALDDRSDLVGQTIGGKYLLTRVLGAGGMGTVYEATNAWTQRRVAVKLMLARHAESAEQVERFLREARAAGRIDHPNVVQVLDVGRQSDGAFYLVQEFLAHAN